MAKRRYTADEIVTVLRQVEVAMPNDKDTSQACRESGIAEQTYYRWRKEYGGLKLGILRQRTATSRPKCATPEGSPGK
jgi:transposase-like protein